jgi:hypothetical protein
MRCPALSLLAVATVGVAATARPDPASLRVAWGSIDPLGTAPLERTVLLRLPGARIERIESSCGCATAASAAGKAGTVALRVRLDRRRLKTGPFEKTVQVFVVGRPDRPAATITLVGSLAAAVRFSPAALDFGRAPFGAARIRTVRVWHDPRLGDRLRLVATHPDLRIEPDGGGAGFRVTLPEDARLGPVSGLLGFVRESAAVPDTEEGFVGGQGVILTGEVVGSFGATVRVIAFGSLRAGYGAIRRIPLTGDSAGAEVIVSSPRLGARLDGAVLEVRLRPEAAVGGERATVTLTSTRGERLVLPVYLSVVGP